MLIPNILAVLAAVAIGPSVSAASSQAYNWQNVKIGGGGGFTPDIIFNPSEKGLTYARMDIGGAYKMNTDGSWTPLLDWADNTRWDYWGVDAIATDPVDTGRLYLAVGMYTNSYDPNNGTILISTDYGTSFTESPLPFKVGGNMPSRGINNILYFGARSGHGLWKSTDYGATWTNVTNFPSVGTYAPDPSDTTGYNSDLTGLAFVTFDYTSGTSGEPTPTIFVGVANEGSDNIFYTNDAGATWSAVAGQNNTYLPHKGVLSPAEKVLYISESNGSGPYDGTLGAVYKYNITSGVWTDITPVSGSNLFFGFGGLSVDLQNPGTIMVAALNSWYPDGQIFRSNDSGVTWSALWSWGSDSTLDKWYTYSDSLAPWIGPDYTVTTPGTLQIGWMMEGLNIDPFDSDHWLYGTGMTIYGGYDLTKWDTVHNVTIESLANGVEETAILGLISPPSGPPLLSAVGDIEGFVHYTLNTPPNASYTNRAWTTTADIDFAGNKPSNIVRVGTATSSTVLQVSLSTDSGATWSPDYGAAANVTGGHVALSADGDTVLWSTGTNGVMVSQNMSTFTAVTSLPSGSIIASDKLNDSIFYAASGADFYLSVDGGETFDVTSTLGSSTAPVKIVVNPSLTGDVWVSSDKGIFHSTDTGSSFTALSAPSEAWAIALGAPASSGGYPALYAAADISGLVGYYRSDDTGATWVQINDAAHGFAQASANVMTGDPRIYGRVYIGTNGRGIWYGDIA
ncbi:glycoside hydrolase family 74 protein [Serpula lacrymans var. lacrymans S7.3]|uniref:Glycoside hydrolase family 74 protein n=1 Tax=Serpula lacrymans var. lacrymans (strain S7.3) TaxID=936435 RepID=F8QBH1_SERL3|nr:glycoside hydrolase family 74 protein [Serpula lacrymans var. lacrymans S7.3]